MKIIILEDEFAAQKNLITILEKVNPLIEIIAVLNSVKSAISWLDKNDSPDLGFFDIQLSDDNVFNMFSARRIMFPIIFTTAFSDYAIEAFKVHSIDYILKPISEESVRFALKKYESLEAHNIDVLDKKISSIVKQIQESEANQYKKSLLVSFKDKLIPVTITDIAFFYIDCGIVYAYTKDKHKYVVDSTLDQVEDYLDPEIFRRANRQFIINRSAIREMSFFFNGRYALKIHPTPPSKVIISKARSSDFIDWMDS